MSFCEQCGKPLHEGARFCGACGAVVPEEKIVAEAAVEAPAEPTAWSCKGCAAENPAEALFCSRCGAGREAAAAAEGRTQELPTAVMAAATGRQPAPATDLVSVPDASVTDGTAGGGTGAGAGFARALRTPWIIALIALLVAVAVTTGVLIFAIHGNNHQEASATFDSSSQAIVAPLSPLVTSVASGLPSSLAHCRWSTKLTAATSAAQRLQSVLVQSQSDAGKLVSQNTSQASSKQALTAALGSLGAYAQAVSVLPAQLSAVTPAQAQALQRAATAAQAACQHLHAVAPTLPPMTLESCAIMTAGARKANKDASLRLFLTKVQNDILDQSQNGRSDLVQAVSGVVGMTLNPDDAANTIESVQSNRQSLLDQLSAMTEPNDTRASRIFNLLQQSLQHSIEADRYYAAWMHEVYNYYYQPPMGYMGNVPHDANYDSALAQDNMAGAAKRRFCRVYDPIARRLGLRANWREGEI